MTFGLKSAEHVRRAMKAARETTVWIGIQSTQGAQPKTSPSPTPADGDVPNLADVAAVHEYGAVIRASNGRTYRVPRRSFLRSTADAKGKSWLKAFRRAIKSYATGDESDYDRVIGTIGVVATKAVARTIRARIAPPLSARTIAARRQRAKKRMTANDAGGSSPKKVKRIRLSREDVMESLSPSAREAYEEEQQQPKKPKKKKPKDPNKPPKKRVSRKKPRGAEPDDVPLIDTGQLIGSIRAQAQTVAGPRLIG